MNIIFIAKKQASQSLHLSPRSLWLLSGVAALFLVGILVTGVWMGYALKSQANDVNAINSQENITALKQQSEEYVSVLAARVAQLQARMVRLDALGERLAKGADLDDGEFNFKLPPAQGGGPDEGLWLGEVVSPQELDTLVSDLDKRIDDRQQQLGILDGFISHQQLAFNQYLRGLPVDGSVTSDFGYRIHPITGRRKLHKGIDIAASYSSDIIAPAPGVVTYSGWRGGYGRTVEIDHGNGLVTRYAHNSKNLAEVGEVISKGDLIALVGSSGRSTGPHVHFEVMKNGKAVNPWDYLSSSESM